MFSPEYINQGGTKQKASKRKPSNSKGASLLKHSFTQFLYFSLLLFSLLNSSLAHSQTAPSNTLSQNSNPYLAMHATDPVHWQSWSPQVIEQAKMARKLIFLSSGYFSCHWCHVMQAENYQNRQSAKLLNQHFISVKIDRELNPEIDKIMTEFASQATGQSGWPQHVILTPDGYPFAAFIYLKNTDFNTTLKNIVQTWQTQSPKIQQLALANLKAAGKPSEAAASKPIDAESFKSALISTIENSMDELSGGLKGSSKFPEAPLLNTLLQMPDLPESIEEWLLLTLDQIQNQHLHDHIHGGFYRYAVDPEWQTPHFEKMAYSSALLSKTYLLAGQRFKRNDYLTTAQQTFDYLEKHLYNPISGLFQSSQSAINLKGQEGGDYLWSLARLKKQLTAQEFQAIEAEWNLQDAAPYDLGWHPKRLSLTDKDMWQSIRQKLQTPVEQIPIDYKSILGWNGLILSAYAQAYRTLKVPRYQQKGQALAIRLYKLIQSATPPRALSQSGQVMGAANLQDYAFIYQGLKDWIKMTDSTEHPFSLAELELIILDKFYRQSGWQYDAGPQLPWRKNEWIMPDKAIPSPAAMVSCLAKQTLKHLNKALRQAPIKYASYLRPIQQCSP